MIFKMATIESTSSIRRSGGRGRGRGERQVKEQMFSEKMTYSLNISRYLKNITAAFYWKTPTTTKLLVFVQYIDQAYNLDTQVPSSE